MTDQQRGAYTPQQDVPLQFDPRSPASSRPMPMALIASGTLLVVLVAAVAMYYSRGVRGDNEPPRPVGEPVAALKSAPAPNAQPADPNAGLDVAAPQNVPGKAPVFAAAPEAPKPRPAPAASKLTVQTVSAADMQKAAASAPPPVVAVAAPPAVVKAPVVKTVATATVQTATPATTYPSTAVAPKTVAPKTVVTTTKVAATTVAPAATATAAAATTSPAKAATVKTAAALASGVRVQIGAFSSAALADKGYSDVSTLMPGSMSGRGKHVEPVDKDGHTLYRTSVTGFGDRAAAEAFCDALKAKGKICFVKS